MDDKHTDTDEASLRSALAERPRSARLNKDLARLLDEKGERGEAVLASLMSLERATPSPTTLLSALRVLEHAGLNRLAVMLGEGAPADSPTGAKLNLVLARLQAKLGAFDRATEHLLRAESIDGPSDKTTKIRSMIEKRREIYDRRAAFPPR